MSAKAESIKQVADGHDASDAGDAAGRSGLLAGLRLCIREVKPIFDKFYILELISKHSVFNAEEAAAYCRCSVETIHYHATRSKKLKATKISRDGPVFLKSHLDEFLQASSPEGFRDQVRRNDRAN